jgi:hypothetical protein
MFFKQVANNQNFALFLRNNYLTIIAEKRFFSALALIHTLFLNSDANRYNLFQFPYTNAQSNPYLSRKRTKNH